MAEDKAKLVDLVQKYITKGDWGRALDALHKLNALLNGKDLRVRIKIGDAFVKLGKKEEAIKEYRDVAESYAKQGFTAQAIAVNKLVEKLDPSLAEVHKKVAELQREAGIIQQSEVATTPPPAPPAVTTKKQAADVKRVSVPRTPLFSDLTDEELAYAGAKVSVRHVPAGSYVFREGDEGNSILIISHGEVRIITRTPGGKEIEAGRLREGEFFGEFAYFSNSKRQASVSAVVDTELLEFTKTILSEISTRHPRINEVLLGFYKERVADKLLATSMLFNTLNPQDRKEILRKFTPKGFATGDLVIQEGCPGDYLYLIKSGEAEVTTWKDDREIFLASIANGEFFGEISLVTGAPRTATVRAKTALETMRLSREDLIDVASRFPQIKKVIDDVIKKRVEDTIKTVLDTQKLWAEGLV